MKKYFSLKNVKVFDVERGNFELNTFYFSSVKSLLEQQNKIKSNFSKTRLLLNISLTTKITFYLTMKKIWKNFAHWKNISFLDKWTFWRLKEVILNKIHFVSPQKKTDGASEKPKTKSQTPINFKIFYSTEIFFYWSL